MHWNITKSLICTFRMWSSYGEWDQRRKVYKFTHLFLSSRTKWSCISSISTIPVKIQQIKNIKHRLYSICLNELYVFFVSTAHLVGTPRPFPDTLHSFSLQTSYSKKWMNTLTQNQVYQLHYLCCTVKIGYSEHTYNELTLTT